ncbi:hypothetical protein NS506_02385 [Nocardia seriolae]|uniref:Helicase XPB/Ssl2 N-terminal domain-containing protein n=1 Tax=Nocardia seriolae TaxID=37332 RepID=A0ABC8AQM1_9NOCA|nr:hypothetical protein [Nocardia seriolae]APA96451.1 hypothetical protein NS506_02385 [Nocardia seriolae]
MRTYFEPEDGEAFEVAKDLLIRRCTARASDRGHSLDPFAMAAALDFRHHGIDGRLGDWTSDLVAEFLLSYVPRTLSISARDAAGLPETLRLLLDYLRATGLADPTGDPLTDLEAAITKAAAEFPAAMTDERNFGPAKFWVMTAIGHGVDPTDGAAMGRFLDDADAGRIDYDDAVLTHIATRHARESLDRPDRAMPQLPVSLPAEDELAAAAEHTRVVGRLRALTDWVGDGRALTATGNVKLADARELATLLNSGDTFDPRIGEQVFRTKSSTELVGLTRLIELAKTLRLVRVVKNRLVRVAKNAPLLRDGLALWAAAFDALPTPDILIAPNSWSPDHTRMLDSVLDQVLPDVLNTVYGLPEPMPVIRLAESVWSACTHMFYLDALGPEATLRWRKGIGADLRRLLGQLVEFGAAELTVGRPDPMFLSDLDPDRQPDPDDPASLPPDVQDRLRTALAPDAEHVELISLTPLATRAVRARMLREGRHAPLVGELTHAEPAQLLGTIAEHYSAEAAEAEIGRWLTAHGGLEHGLPRLLDGVRDCPFRTRAGAMLDVLTQTLPDRSAFLHRLRADTQLGPIATLMLIDSGEISLGELDPEEGLRTMAEQFITLLEVGGADAVTGALAELPADQVRDMVAAMLDSGHPDRIGLDELHTLADAQLTDRRPGHAAVHPLARAPRSSRRHSKRKGRRR